jgi:hypothetical protein
MWILLSIAEDVTSILSSAIEDGTQKSFTKFAGGVRCSLPQHAAASSDQMLQKSQVKKFGVSPTQLSGQHSNNVAAT